MNSFQGTFRAGASGSEFAAWNCVCFFLIVGQGWGSPGSGVDGTELALCWLHCCFFLLCAWKKHEPQALRTATGWWWEASEWRISLGGLEKRRRGPLYSVSSWDPETYLCSQPCSLISPWLPSGPRPHRGSVMGSVFTLPPVWAQKPSA